MDSKEILKGILKMLGFYVIPIACLIIAMINKTPIIFGFGLFISFLTYYIESNYDE